MTTENVERPYDLDLDGIFKLRLERRSFPFLEKKLSIWKSSYDRPDITVSRGEVSSEALPFEGNRLFSEKGY